MRGINGKFINDLKSGELTYFFEQVKADTESLCLAIRNNYINIYFRGGNLLKITQKRGGYSFHFDAKYCLNKGDDSSYDLLCSLSDTNTEGYKKYFTLMMAEMESWLEKHPKPEREYQHKLIAFNPSVVDIEYQIGKKMRLDMLCVDNGRLCVVENKYGETTVGGVSGLSKHYEDICRLVADKDVFDEMKASVVNIIAAKKQLGLPTPATDFDCEKAPQVLFLFAKYNKKSQMINNELRKISCIYPAKYIFLEKNDVVLDFNTAEDLFDYGS